MGQSVYVTGNNNALGNWSPTDAVKLDPTAYPTWSGSINLPAETSIEWKCLKRSETDPSAQQQWQSGDNNLVQTAGEGTSSSTSGSF